MILKIAWKNIWRNKVRSFVVIAAIGLGLWAGVFGSAFISGMMKSKVETSVRNEISHFQIHLPHFRDEYNGRLVINDSESIYDDLVADPDVAAVSERVISMAMMASSRKTTALKVVGVLPENESVVTQLNENIIEGSYFETKKKNPIVISQETAEDYSIKVNSKVVVTIQDVHGEITSGAFKVVGIFKTSNNLFDKMNAFVDIKDMRRLYNMNQGAHEIAVWLKDHELAEQKATTYQEKYSMLEILPWLDLQPGMRMMIDMFDTYLYIIVGIILFALLFSIVNTMLMAVLERVREIGMLMAIGMTKGRVFQMIMLETVIMSMVGSPIGLFLSWLFISYFGQAGISLSGASYEDLGFSSTIYPFLDASRYFEVALMVFAMALIASIYPAIKALRLKPVNAIRKV